MVKQQFETSVSLQKETLKHNIPKEIIKVIDSYVFDAELVKLSHSKHKIQKKVSKEQNENENSNLKQKASSLKPYDIFEMYTSTNCIEKLK